MDGAIHVAHMGDEVLLRKIRGIWPGVLVLNRGGADLPTRIADIDNGTADVIAVASMSLANPDLVERIKRNTPLNAPDPSTFTGAVAQNPLEGGISSPRSPSGLPEAENPRTVRSSLRPSGDRSR
jgi:2,4-dienoyl-CoA reductase-like NADH-dependent reductase (Old Yellow Enzyme family)